MDELLAYIHIFIEIPYSDKLNTQKKTKEAQLCYNYILFKVYSTHRFVFPLQVMYTIKRQNVRKVFENHQFLTNLSYSYQTVYTLDHLLHSLHETHNNIDITLEENRQYFDLLKCTMRVLHV